MKNIVTQSHFTFLLVKRSFSDAASRVLLPESSLKSRPLLEEQQKRLGEVLIGSDGSPIYLALGEGVTQEILTNVPVLSMRHPQLLATGVDIHLMPGLRITHLQQSHIWQGLGAWVIYLYGNDIVLLVGYL